jgi:muramoyltetrapeptide carboxypeptidase
MVVGGGSIVRPRRVRPGDVVGVVAPAGPIDPARLAAGVAVLESWGLRPRVGDSVLARRAYLAGDDEARAADLAAMLADPEVRAVLCARGGYGSQRIVPALDLGALRADPKPVVGYSDNTALLAAVVGAGVAAVHGPMVAADLARGLAAASADAFHATLFDPSFRLHAAVPTPVRGGRARGRLVGGCLSVLATTLGTRWAFESDDCILFLEDVHEWPYRLDRLLVQLRQAGRFERVAGVVLGTFAACREADGVTPLDVVRAAFADAPFPVGFGLAAGHSTAESDVENLALPLGMTVELDVDAGRLVASEALVV